MIPDRSYAPIFVVSRGEIVESIHYGSIAVVSSDGKIIAFHGDPFTVTYLRSSAKPLQVLPFIEEDGQAAFDLTSQEIALMCASHAGTDEHMAVLKGLQGKTGVTEDDLLCGIHPLSYKSAAKALQLRGESLSPNRHNCSGKHTGMLAYARYLGASKDDYIKPEHPVQQKILAAFAQMCSLDPNHVQIGVDGCSAPNFAVPLHRAALAIARLCDPDRLGAGLPENRIAACRTITQAMLAHPGMIAGPISFDTLLMTAADGRVLSKGGAEGYQVLGVMPGVLYPTSPGLGIAYKISDGDLKSRSLTGGDTAGYVRPAVGLEILRQLGMLPQDLLEQLANFGPGFPLYNWRGLHVGEGQPCFQLSFEPDAAGVPAPGEKGKP
jgi:L-asparaginase II